MTRSPARRRPAFSRTAGAVVAVLALDRRRPFRVNHELASAGDAEAILVEPNSAQDDLFVSDEASAQGAGIGQWGVCGLR